MVEKRCDFEVLSAFFNRFALPLLLINSTGEVIASNRAAKVVEELFSDFSLKQIIEGKKIPLCDTFSHLGHLFQLLIFPIDSMQKVALVIKDIRGLLAHDMRNDLVSIKGFAGLLTRELEEQPKSKQLAGYIVQSADHLHTLIQQFEGEKW